MLPLPLCWSSSLRDRGMAWKWKKNARMSCVIVYGRVTLASHPASRLHARVPPQNWPKTTKTTQCAHRKRASKAKCDSQIVCCVILLKLIYMKTLLIFFVISLEWRTHDGWLHYVIRCKWTMVLFSHSWIVRKSCALAKEMGDNKI